MCPILYELDQIEQHYTNTHTIIINNVNLIRGGHFQINIYDVISRLLDINENYTIRFFDNNESTCNIIVAYIKENVCIHTYLQNCLTNPQPPGFGDFLRGTMTLHHFSHFYNYKLVIDNSHPIFNYLKSKHIIKINTNQPVTELLPPLSYLDIYIMLNNLFTQKKAIRVMTNSFYDRNERGDMLNFGALTDGCKQYMRELLVPSEYIIKKINSVYELIGMNQSNRYSIIHMRIGDKCLNDSNHNLNNDLVHDVDNKVSNLINNNRGVQFVLITDSIQLGNYLKSRFSQLYYWENKKIHLGDLKNNNDGIADTLTDFFIISKSKKIYSLNESGFSTMPALIYDIEYVIL